MLTHTLSSWCGVTERGGEPNVTPPPQLLVFLPAPPPLPSSPSPFLPHTKVNGLGYMLCTSMSLSPLIHPSGHRWEINWLNNGGGGRGGGGPIDSSLMSGKTKSSWRPGHAHTHTHTRAKRRLSITINGHASHGSCPMASCCGCCGCYCLGLV